MLGYRIPSGVAGAGASARHGTGGQGSQPLSLIHIYAVLAGNGPAHFLRLGHDPHGGFFRDFKHVQVIGVDGDIDVTVPVARVHVARHHNAADKQDVYKRQRASGICNWTRSRPRSALKRRSPPCAAAA